VVLINIGFHNGKVSVKLGTTGFCLPNGYAINDRAEAEDKLLMVAIFNVLHSCNLMRVRIKRIDNRTEIENAALAEIDSRRERLLSKGLAGKFALPK